MGEEEQQGVGATIDGTSEEAPQGIPVAGVIRSEKKNNV